jgi:hypothetical protein
MGRLSDVDELDRASSGIVGGWRPHFKAGDPMSGGGRPGPFRAALPLPLIENDNVPYQVEDASEDSTSQKVKALVKTLHEIG